MDYKKAFKKARCFKFCGKFYCCCGYYLSLFDQARPIQSTVDRLLYSLHNPSIKSSVVWKGNDNLNKKTFSAVLRKQNRKKKKVKEIEQYVC